ncbi:hypothetical protein [Neorhizobium galegae]|uniref:hypothetical protein n=1 Tax=Neorhizobium galegae TaxID=399 RepID=UPI0012D49F45|nr:hypothetical protein [Neorhizobium galegae]
MEPAVSRRRVLTGIGAASASAAVLAAPVAARPDTIGNPMARARFHAEQLAEAMAAINPDASYKIEIDVEHHFALIHGRAKRDVPAYDGRQA